MMNSSRTAPALAALLLVCQSAPAASLIEVYGVAVTSDPLLKEAGANRMATLEAKPQAMAALLPQISGQARAQNVYSGGSNTFTQAVQDPNTGQTTIQSITTDYSQNTTPARSWQLDLNQTVFRWDQWVTLKQADKQLAQAEAEYRAAEQDLMARVVQRYFDVLGAKATLSASEAAKESIGRQLEQAEKRFEVGLIAITDVQESQASYDSATAGVIEAKRALAVAKEFLREITGQYYEHLADAGPGTPLISPAPDDVDTWVATALKQNLALEASRLGAEITRDNISLQKSGHLPTLDFYARRGGNNDDVNLQNRPQQEGATIVPGKNPADRSDNTDVIGLQLSVPLFSGGSVRSKVRQSEYQHQASLESLERVARETERQVRDSFLSVNAEISRVKALAKSVESNQTALRATEAGFEVGTRTTVDVLVSRRNLFEAQRDYARSRYTYLTNSVFLKRAAGTLGTADLELINSWLKE